MNICWDTLTVLCYWLRLLWEGLDVCFISHHCVLKECTVFTKVECQQVNDQLSLLATFSDITFLSLSHVL